MHQPFTMKLDYYKGIHICIITCLIFVIMLYPPQNVSSNFIIKPHLLYCLLNYSKNKIWSTSLKQGHKEKAWVVKDYLMRWRTALPFQMKGITMSSHTSQIPPKKKKFIPYIRTVEPAMHSHAVLFVQYLKVLMVYVKSVLLPC